MNISEPILVGLFGNGFPSDTDLERVIDGVQLQLRAQLDSYPLSALGDMACVLVKINNELKDRPLKDHLVPGAFVYGPVKLTTQGFYFVRHPHEKHPRDLWFGGIRVSKIVVLWGITREGDWAYIEVWMVDDNDTEKVLNIYSIQLVTHQLLEKLQITPHSLLDILTLNVERLASRRRALAEKSTELATTMRTLSNILLHVAVEKGKQRPTT